jgi:hypothetical protein
MNKQWFINPGLTLTAKLKVVQASKDGCRVCEAGAELARQNLVVLSTSKPYGLIWTHVRTKVTLEVKKICCPKSKFQA